MTCEWPTVEIAAVRANTIDPRLEVWADHLHEINATLPRRRPHDDPPPSIPAADIIRRLGGTSPTRASHRLPRRSLRTMLVNFMRRRPQQTSVQEDG